MVAWSAEGNMPDMAGRTVLVTGANSGLGLRSAEAFAAAGARVLMGCRDPDRADRAWVTVASHARDRPPEVALVDLADLGSVRRAARELADRTDRLDVLLNNAGIMGGPYRKTVDGFELQFGTNHLGHFALTGQVLPLLLAVPGARVVTVSSNMHRLGHIVWDDPNHTFTRYTPWGAYAQSKLANLLFTRELARRAAEAGRDLVAVAAHPGAAATNLFGANARRSGSGLTRAVGVMAKGAARVFSQSEVAGARPLLYAATEPGIRPGDYVGPFGPGQLRGRPTLVKASRAANDDESAPLLWEMSERLTGVTYDWGEPPAR
jgi:NAD(P)-dependent dehydrogenase (short-subunit alcohol dehydrogenase family)